MPQHAARRGRPPGGGTGYIVLDPGLCMIQLYTGTDYPCHHTRRKGEALPQACRAGPRPVSLGSPSMATAVLDGPKVATLAT